MKNIIRRAAVTISLLIAGCLPLAAPLTVSAASSAKTDVCQAINSGTDCKSNGNGGITIQSIITFVVNTLSIIVGIAAIIMIVISGFRFINSGGDPSKVASAKSGLIYALVGLVIAATAQTLVHFVLTQANGGGTCKSNPQISVNDKACKDKKTK